MTQINLLDKHELCTKEDDFLYDKTIWMASLSNDVIVYQDDDRLHVQEPSAWKRLGSYISETSPEISIIRMYLKFRSHVIDLPSNAKGYYFANGMSMTTDDNVQRGYLVCGAVIDGAATCQWYNIPELTVSRKDQRPLSKLEAPFLILNPT